MGSSFIGPMHLTKLNNVTKNRSAKFTEYKNWWFSTR